MIESRCCWIRVSHGDGATSEGLESELSEMGIEKKDRKLSVPHFLDGGYTYVSLEVGRPYRSDRQTQVSKRCHVTIAYAATMSERQMDELQRGLTDVLQSYLQKEPADRPWELPNFRKVFFKDENAGPYDVGEWAPLISYTMKEVEAKMRQGLIERPLSSDPDEPLESIVRRIRERDSFRYYRAIERADHVQTHTGELFMDTPHSGLGDSPELRDLLEYLADIVYHWRTCHFVKPENGKTLPPCVTSIDRWHCSRQGDWQHAPIMQPAR